MKPTPRLLIICCLLLKVAAWSSDLTFLHVSDVHYPYAKDDSAATIAALPRAPIALTPYGVTSDAPAFAIVTGDLNEFGGGGGNWEGYLGLWKDWPLPVYQQLGNHDNTWDCARPRLRALQGSPFYSFEQAGVRFIGFDTATPQDPRPSIPTEGLLWLTSEFAKTPPEQPVIFFCHHPLNGTEFASEYARLRLLELLQTRNVVLILDGHGHGATHRNIAGFDCVMGGSTYGPKRGYGIVSIKDNVLRVCHQFLGDTTQMVPLLDKPLPAKSPFLPIGSITPAEAHIFAGEAPVYHIPVPDLGKVARARWVWGDKAGDLVRGAGEFRAELPDDLPPGAHAVKFEFVDTAGVMTTRAQRFWIDAGPVRIKWLRTLDGSCQSSPTLAGQRLFVGTNDGALQVLNVATGATEWETRMPGELRSKPAILPNGDICAGHSSGVIFVRHPDGKVAWAANLGAPGYASPVVVGDRLICADNKGEIIALSASDGKVLWRCTAPTYAIESGFAASADTVFTGSWDGYVYAINVADGTVRWKSRSGGSNRKAAANYYSPADCAPVYAGGKLFIADRAMMLNILDAVTGQLLSSEKDCSAVGPGAGDTVLTRQTDGRGVTRRRADGSVAWESKVPTGFLPVPPIEADGKVWMVSGLGTLSALDSATGKLLAQYQVAPGLFVFAAPAASGEMIYVADEAGDVVALELGE